MSYRVRNAGNGGQHGHAEQPDSMVVGALRFCLYITVNGMLTMACVLAQLSACFLVAHRQRSVARGFAA